MPPKGSTKNQTKEQTKTPQKTKAEGKAAAATPTKVTKQTPKREDVKKEAPKPETPKKTKPAPVKITKLARDKNAALPIDVTFQGEIAEAKQVKSHYAHALKLDGAAPFTLVYTYLVPEGEKYEGHQIVLLKPAQAFKFMKLAPEIRLQVYTLYFWAKGQEVLPITLDGKRKNESKDPYAKSYAQGSKNRVALLAVSKQINMEAAPVLYARPLRFDSPATLLTFFAGLESSLRILLRHVEIRQYVKKDAKTALAFLAEAKNLNHLRIEVGVANNADVTAAAKNFWADACKLLETVGARKEKGLIPLDEKQSKEESSDDEEDDDDEDEEESEDGGEDEDEENDDGVEETEETGDSKVEKPKRVDEPKTEESKDSDSKHGKDASSDVDMSDDNKDTTIDAPATAAEDAKTVVTDTNAFEDTKPATVTDADAREGVKVEEGTKATFSDDKSTGQEATNSVKKDSKSPAPQVTATKPKSTESEEPKTRKGRKNDAITILHFGKAAFKYKNKDKEEVNWTAAMKEKFLTELKAKLK